MVTTLKRILILIAVFTERYLLSVFYFGFTWVEIYKISAIWSGQFKIENTVFVDIVRHLVLLLLNVFTALLLLLGRRPVLPPDKFKFILVPLATTFFNLVYYTIPSFPAAFRTSLCPQGLQTPLAAAGLACIIIGPMIALWGLMYLGRSFGVFVTLRKIVATGPYQWVRHPMYLGWVCMCTGIALANFSGAFLIIVAVHISLLLYRAHLEETYLAQHSAEYQEYMKHAGFIFPRFRSS